MTDNHYVPPQLDDSAQTRGDTTQQDPFTQFLNHQKKAIDEVGKAIDALLPAGFKEHGNEARKEFIKGWKTLVDAAVVELEKASKEVDQAFKRTRQDPPSSGGDDRPSSTGKTKVKVQVD